MAGSTLSLDSLSSPSPSPSPPPNQQIPHSSSSIHTGPPTAPTAAPFRTIDTDSELSELTDDDQDASTAADKRATSTTTPSSSKGASRTAIDDDDNDPPTTDNNSLAGSSLRTNSMRGMQRYPNSSRRGGAGRKKRSSIVPAPMWGWVPEKTAANAAAVEEEEEEMTGPPRAMEEEEEEEDEEEEEEEEEEGDDYDAYDNGESGGGEEAHNRRGFIAQRRQGPYPTKRMPANQPYSNKTRGTVARQSAGTVRRNPRKQDEDYEDEDMDDDTLKVEKRPRQLASAKRVSTKHENDDDRPIANGGDDEGSASGGSEYFSTKRKKVPRSRPTTSSRKRKGSENEESGTDVPVSSRRKNGVKGPVSDHGGEAGSASNEEDNTDSDAEGPKPNPPAQPLSPSKLTNSKPLSAISHNIGNSATSALSALAALANAVDPTSPPSREVVSINAAAASSSIMSGANSVEVPASGNTSGTGTRHASRSRSNSAAAKSDAESSAEESKSARRQSKGGKPITRGGKSRARGKAPVADKKHLPVTTNGDAEKFTVPAKKGPPAPLDLKIDSSIPNIIAAGDQDMDIDEEANDHAEDADVDMDPSERDNAEEEDDDGEDEVDNDSVHDEDEEQEHGEEEIAEVDQDADEEAVEADDDAPDQDGEDDQEQEQENDQDAAEVEQENEEGDEVDNDDEHPSPDADVDVDVEDHESDLQPAHRAEALDVLATIELKFALLRERVYVEKMEALAWEEMLVQNAAHPEFQHLQKELLKRRDKRLELASKKRSYEVANAETRRNADESNIWSWWKFTRDDLQTEMIAETNRKRRKLERERRAMERPQPIRRIPHPSDVLQPPMAPPSLRKIIKSYPFGSRKQNKSDTHHHYHHSHYPKNLVYPEISTLSATDIQSDLDYFFQYRRTTAYDQQQQHHQPHYPLQLQRNISGMSGIGMGRSTSMMPNGPPPPVQIPQSSMGPPPQGSAMHQHASQHGMGYDSYGDISHAFNPLGAPPRVREQYGPQGPGGPLSGGPPPPGSSRDNNNVYSNFAGPSSRLPQHGGPMPMGGSQHHGYPSEHEMSTMAPGPNNSGIGHQIHPNHPYFGQGSMTSGNGSNPHGPLPPSGHMSNHHSNNMKGGMSINDRRSMSPSHGLPNGNLNSKTNGSWIDPSMGSANFHGRNGGGSKGADWDPRMMHEEEERERSIREQRKRDEREKEKEHRGREMERARREREYELESRQHELQHVQQLSQQHRQPPPQGPSSSHSGLSHMHSSGNGPPPAQGSGNASHLHNHYHHRGHHHHVVHHHHPQQGPQHASSTMPLSGVGGGAPPIIHSPRSTREYEGARSQGPIHAGPGQPHPTELIMLSSNKRDAPVHWPNKNVEEAPHHSSIVDYRDRDRGEGLNRERNERDRDLRKMHSGRHSTGPTMPLDDRSDRPMAMPFVMASSHAMQQTTAGMPMNGSGLSSSTSSPRGAPSWNGPGALEDPSYRTSSSAPPPSGYLGSPRDAHVRSPVQGHRYASSSGSHVPPPLGRGGNNSTSVMHHRMASPPPPSGRARPPPSPSYTTAAHHSPVISPKVRALSPVPVNSSAKHILSGPIPGPGYSSSPHLSGPGLASGPTGHQPPLSSSGPTGSMQDVIMKNGNLPYVGSRTASPLMSSLQGSGRATVNGSNADRDRMDRDRDRPSPRLGASSVPLAPPSKFGTPQMVDGH